MKKISILVLGFSVLMAVLQVDAETPARNKPAPVSYDALFKLLPKSTTCLIAGDPAKFPIEIEDPKWTGILKKSGIDPEKDIHAIMMGLAGPPIGKGAKAVLLISLKFQKDSLLANIKELVKGIREADYGGVTLYEFPGDAGAAGAFLGDSIIVYGDPEIIKPMIDVRRYRSDSVRTNPEMKKILKTVDQSKAIWGAARFYPETIANAAENEPALSIFEGTTGLTVFLDNVDQPDGSSNIILEFCSLGGGEGHNQRLAEDLNILKGVGLALTSQHSVLSWLVSSLDVLPGKDSVRLRTTLSGSRFVDTTLDVMSDFAAAKEIGRSALEILRATALRRSAFPQK